MSVFVLHLSVVLLVGMAGWSQAQGIFDLPEELPFTMAINQHLCEPGNHPDSVTKQFFACYQETITPGGCKFVECQKEIYGVLLNSEANLDKGCALPADDYFPRYDACLTKKLNSAGQNIAITWNRLNECQGAALGVQRPGSTSSTSMPNNYRIENRV